MCQEPTLEFCGRNHGILLVLSETPRTVSVHKKLLEEALATVLGKKQQRVMLITVKLINGRSPSDRQLHAWIRRAKALPREQAATGNAEAGNFAPRGCKFPSARGGIVTSNNARLLRFSLGLPLDEK
eukprot:6036066-Amphidinium_carterae.1